MSTYYADFGPLTTQEDVAQDIIGALRHWLPTFISEFERERSLAPGTLPRPRGESYATVRREEDWVDHRLPMVIIESPGTIDVQAVSADGEYVADYMVLATVIARGPTYPETQKWCSYLEGCVRRVLLSGSAQPLMPGRCWWLASEPIRPVAGVTDSGRYMCSAPGRYRVAVDSVAQSGAGPVSADPYPTPPDDPDVPYDPLVQVVEVTTEVDGLSPSQQIGG